jgi:hypothetical protein
MLILVILYTIGALIAISLYPLVTATLIPSIFIKVNYDIDYYELTKC